MPNVQIRHVVSFSSQDKKHAAANLLLCDGKKKWLCEEDEKSGRLEGVFQLDRSCVISNIDIGTFFSFTVEIQVGRSSWPSNKEFLTLVPNTPLMSLVDCREGRNKEALRMFKSADFKEDVRNESWDLLKIVCSQPFRKDVQFGVSMLRVVAQSGDGSDTENLTSPNSTRKSNNSPVKSVLELHRHFFGNKNKSQSPAVLQKPSIGIEKGAPLNALSRQSKLVMAAVSKTPTYKKYPESEPQKTTSSPKTKPISFDDEVDKFLKTIDLKKLDFENFTFAQLRHRLEKWKQRKLTKEERKIFFSKAKQFIGDNADIPNDSPTSSPVQAKTGNSNVRVNQTKTENISPRVQQTSSARVVQANVSKNSVVNSIYNSASVSRPIVNKPVVNSSARFPVVNNFKMSSAQTGYSLNARGTNRGTGRPVSPLTSIDTRKNPNFRTGASINYVNDEAAKKKPVGSAYEGRSNLANLFGGDKKTSTQNNDYVVIDDYQPKHKKRALSGEATNFVSKKLKIQSNIVEVLDSPSPPMKAKTFSNYKVSQSTSSGAARGNTIASSTATSAAAAHIHDDVSEDLLSQCLDASNDNPLGLTKKKKGKKSDPNKRRSMPSSHTPCPICGALFPANKLPMHVNTCDNSIISDDDDEPASMSSTPKPVAMVLDKYGSEDNLKKTLKQTLDTMAQNNSLSSQNDSFPKLYLDVSQTQRHDDSDPHGGDNEAHVISDNPEEDDNIEDCPICGQAFPVVEIVAHAATCNGESLDVNSRARYQADDSNSAPKLVLNAPKPDERPDMTINFVRGERRKAREGRGGDSDGATGVVEEGECPLCARRFPLLELPMHADRCASMFD